MKHSFLIWGIVLLFATGTAVASALVIYGVLPNTVDDANLEYIDIYNDSCDTISLAWVSLRDLSGKKYTFTGGTLASGEYRRVSRTESKIILNNTDETIDILDPNGNSIHQVRYSTSVSGIPIQWSVSTPSCHVETVEETVVEILPDELPPADSGTGNIQNPANDSTMTGSSSGWASGAAELVVSTSSGSAVSESGVVTATGSSAGSSATGSVSPESWITIVLDDAQNVPASNSGTAANSGAMLAPIDTTVLVPLRLYLYDLDANGKIERLSVEYSWMLSGSLNPEKLLVYSASGGLADHDIETGSGVIRMLSYSGTFLVVDMYEQNLAHTNLRISSSASSELRLKSLSGFGLANLSGTPVLPLTLTQSFSGYDAAHIVNAAATIPLPPLGIQPVQPNYAPLANGSAPVETMNPPAVPRTLPDPTIVFQSWVTANGACKTAACRINPIHEVREKFEMCRWNIVSTNALQVIDGCNPKTIALGGSGGVVGLTLLDSAGILPFQSRSFRILPYQEAILPKADTPISTKAVMPSVKDPKSSVALRNNSSTLASEISDSGKVPTTSKKNASTATAASKTPKVSAASSKTAVPKIASTKTTTKKTTTTTKTPAAPKEPKAVPIAPAYQKPDTPSDSVTIGIIGIACAGIGFCVALLRRKDAEPVE